MLRDIDLEGGTGKHGCDNEC